MRNKIAVLTNSYHGFSLEQALDGIAAAGFKYVELAAVRGWTEHVMPGMGPERLKQVRRELEERGLTAIGLSGHCDLMDADRLGDFRRNIEMAAFFGCDYIISSVGEAHFGQDKEVGEEVLVEHLKGLVADLEAHDLILAIEVHGPDYGCGEALYRLTRKVDSARIGINYDTANLLYWGGKENPEQEIRTCIDDVKYVHLKDKDGDLKDWNFPAVGSGRLNLKGFMEYMDSVDYAGPYSIEIEFTEEFTMREKTPADLAVANQAVIDSYNYLHSIGRI